ncbi:3-dehydroquinate synthase [Candidatus Berkiella aquae]|nr:3-dehydroquinate synthase [Candidatus Berkiella aquae]MCS5710035.1 3-dehydroquinate synthase [Candidatus Berkiella aquae]
MPAKAYPIFVGYDLLAQPNLFQSHLHKAVCVVSHPEIAASYFPLLEQTLQKAGARKITSLLLPAGDAHKTLAFAEKIWSFLSNLHYHRDTTLIALGGGMIGDLVGYSGACYMRGLDVIQCPTSLLAQVDAAIGGKTAVNLQNSKNLIGLFHQPRMVLSDLNTLQTLPNREFIAGLAELIKYGVILDAALFEWLETHIVEILARKPQALERAVVWASQIKADIVAKDEKDQNLRAVLNFGHTIAHAIESIYHYEKYLHGEAVAMGMIIAMQLSLALGLISANLLDRLIALLTKAGLPIFLPDGITLEAILAKIQLDKKHSQGQIRWVLVEALGQAQLRENVPLPMIYDVLKASGASM